MSHGEDGDLRVSALCRYAGISRQGYYKGAKARRRRDVNEELVVEVVKQERRIQPRVGGRKLHAMYKGELGEAGVKVGRDRFFEILRQRDLLLERVRRRALTTDSRHGFRVYPNLVRHIDPCAIHQIWVSDLTYIATEEGFLYLSLITDACSRKIVGYDASDTLEAQGCLRSQAMALGQLPAWARPIHHSDRGVQYCSRAYVDRLLDRGILISMTEDNHCYENAKAERVNGILKQEYALGGVFRTKAQALLAIEQAIALYNGRRLHQALGYRVPSEVHAEAA